MSALHSNELAPNVMRWYKDEVSKEVKSYGDLYREELVWTLSSKMSLKNVLWYVDAYVCSQIYTLNTRKFSGLKQL